MHRDEADRALSGLRAGQDRVASAMFTIDSHPALGFLRAGGNRGRTQAAWDGLRGEVDALWTEFNTLNELLDSTSVMSTRRLTDAEVATVQRATALAATLEPRCAAAITNLDAVNAAWNACGAAIAPVTDALTGLSSARERAGRDGVRRSAQSALLGAAGHVARRPAHGRAGRRARRRVPLRAAAVDRRRRRGVAGYENAGHAARQLSRASRGAAGSNRRGTRGRSARPRIVPASSREDQ